MHHALITHIVVDELPEIGKKRQVTPICSNPIDIEKEIYFLGYNGSRRLKLTDLEEDTTIHPVTVAIPVQENCSVWIDTDKKVFYYYDDDEILLGNTWEQVGTFTL